MNNIRYVDHIVLIRNTEEKLQEIRQNLVIESKKKGLNRNYKKKNEWLAKKGKVQHENCK